MSSLAPKSPRRPALRRPRLAPLVLALAAMGAPLASQSALLITEIMPSGSGQDWFELTNTGTGVVDLTGFKMDDNSFNFANAVEMQGIGQIAPGESVLFIEDTSTGVFLSNHGACLNGVRVGTYSGSGVGLGGSGDGVIVFNAQGAEQSRQSFGAATAKTSFFYGSDNSAATLSLSGSQGAVTCGNTDIASPGSSDLSGTLVRPGAPTSAVASAATPSGFTAHWSAPGAGGAPTGYIVEVSADGFATLARTLAVDNGTSAPVSGLSASTAYQYRVRAVNTAGPGASSGAQAISTLAGLTSDLAPTAAYSSVIGDAHEPGITFTLTNAAAAPQFSAVSSNPGVVPDANVQVTGTGPYTLQITPVGVGFADITLTIQDGVTTLTRTLKYAASANTATGTSPRWLVGRSDASTAIVHDSNTLLVADDEGSSSADGSGPTQPITNGNAFFAYRATHSGLPLAPLVVDAALGLNNPGLQSGANCTAAGITGSGSNCKAEGEVDLEASFSVGGTHYLAGSHSNSKNGHLRPDRWRFFALTSSGTGAATTHAVAGYYQWLREDLRSWDATNAHGLGADYLGLQASSTGGLAPESANLDGFSIEGATSSPDNTAAWFGFRAPLVSAPGQAAVAGGSATHRSHALIVPVGGFHALATATGGGTKGAALAQIGGPIRLDLGGRGIREIRKNGANEYLIIAGPSDSATGTAPKDFRLYSWDGSFIASGAQQGLATNLRLRDAALSAFTKPHTDCSAEGIGELPAALDMGGNVEILSDCGDADFYGNGTVAKDLSYAAWKKSRLDGVALAALPSVALSGGQVAATALPFTATASEAGTLYAVALPASAAAPSWEQVVAGTDATGTSAPWASGGTAVGTTAVPLAASGLLANTAYTLYAVNVSTGGYASTRGQLNLSTSALSPQAIVFTNPPASPSLLGTAPFTISAIGGASGNPVVFASGSNAVCQVNGTTVTLVTAGTCVLNADQAGGGSYAPGAQSYSFQVSLPTGSSAPLVGTGAYSGTSGAVLGGAWQFASNSAGFKALPGGSAPNGYSFPHGMFDFALIHGASGSSATVQLNLPSAAPAGATLWKYGYETQGATTRTWYPFPGIYNFTNGRMRVEFSIEDGAVGQDDDQVANGIIIDPVALGLPGGPAGAQVAAIPTLGEWARGLLALLLGGLAALRMRRSLR